MCDEEGFTSFFSGMKCCKRCYYGDYNNVYGYGYYYNYYYGYYDYHQANGLPDMRYMSIP